MLTKILTKSTLLNDPRAIVRYLAEDGYGKIDGIHLGKINTRLPLQTGGVLILLLILFTYFRLNVPNTYVGNIPFLLTFVIAILYYWLAKKTYLKASIKEMKNIIKEYRHYKHEDRKTLRNCINEIGKEDNIVGDFSKQIRALFIEHKQADLKTIEKIDKILQNTDKKGSS